MLAESYFHPYAPLRISGKRKAIYSVYYMQGFCIS